MSDDERKRIGASRRRTRRPVLDRLLERIVVDPDTDCWVWTGAISPSGYGAIGLGGRRDGVARTHRVTFLAMVGPIPDGLELDHLCRNRACCNPAHLEPVTRRENVRRGASMRLDATHCYNGHEYAVVGYTTTAGYRTCRACRHASYLRSRGVTA